MKLLRRLHGSIGAALVALGGAALPACVGEIGGNDGDGTVTVDPHAAVPDPSVTSPAGAFPEGALPAAGLVRLTNAQIKRTLRDLLGPDFVLRERLPRDSVNGLGFPTTTPMSALELDHFVRAAEGAGTSVASKLPLGLSCAITEDACIEEVARVFGRRAFRRTLSQNEVASAVTVFRAAQEQWGYSRAEALAAMVQTMLMQPDFLYRTEIGGVDAKPENGSVALTAPELAARLSYLIWGSAPDEELLALGESGALLAPDILAQQAERLLADARSEEGLGDFFVYWLGLDALYDKGKSGDRWYGFWYTKQPQETMLTEVRHLGVAAVRRGDTLRQLLTTREAYVDEVLSEVYDLPKPLASGFATVTLDGTHRAGLLTRAAFLATHAYGDESSPIRRGKAVRVRLLCQKLPPPPVDALLHLPRVPCDSTPREAAEVMTGQASCQACHKLINPLGFAFENFDQGGAYRGTIARMAETSPGSCNGAVEAKPVDTSSTLSGTSVDATFTGPEELGELLGQSKEAKDCFARQLYRFGTGRGEDASDTATIDALADTMRATDGQMKAVVLAFVKSAAFLRHPVSN